MRLRTLTLWAGTLLSLLIAAAFVASGWWMVSVQVPTRYGPGLGVIRGSFYASLGTLLPGHALWFADPVRRRMLPNGRSVPTGPHWQSWNSWAEGGIWINVPLYAVFAVVAIPTLLVWRFVPKFPRGHCRRCGYNLTGLTEARCPECGESLGGRPLPGGSVARLSRVRERLSEGTFSAPRPDPLILHG